MTSIPIILFVYNRPYHLQKTLDCLRKNKVPVIYAFSDGPKTTDKAPAVVQVREMLRAIDWCDVIICERENNLGLGRSILTGVTEVLKKHEAAIIFEDDLICVQGTYEYLCTALNQYRNDARVMSVTGWTHPRVTPKDAVNLPYFDGRAESLVWGTWARAWAGMNDKTALQIMHTAETMGIDRNIYGFDLSWMASVEQERNIWAVRFLYHHILNSGLCLRPPWTMVEHIGFDALATNAGSANGWHNPPLKSCPPIPKIWPEPVAHSECGSLWQNATRIDVSPPTNIKQKLIHAIKRVIGAKGVEGLRRCKQHLNDLAMRFRNSNRVRKMKIKDPAKQ